MGVAVHCIMLIQAFFLLCLHYSLVNTAVTEGPAFSEAYDLIDMSSCGKSKGCYRMPYGCEPTQMCDAIFTWKPSGDRMNFELGGKSNGWVAVGLSKDRLMGSDSVMECFFPPNSGANSQPTTRFSWNNQGKPNSNSVVQSPDMTNTMVKTTGRFYNAYMVCHFNRPIYWPTTDPKVYPIQETKGSYQPYYLQLSLGKMTNDVKTKHDAGIPRVTQFMVQFNNLTIINGARPLAAFSVLTLLSLTAHLM